MTSLETVIIIKGCVRSSQSSVTRGRTKKFGIWIKKWIKGLACYLIQTNMCQGTLRYKYYSLVPVEALPLLGRGAVSVCFLQKLNNDLKFLLEREGCQTCREAGQSTAISKNTFQSESEIFYWSPDGTWVRRENVLLVVSFMLLLTGCLSSLEN